MKSNNILKTLKQFFKIIIIRYFYNHNCIFLFPELKLPQNIIVDKILVEKSKRKMNVFLKAKNSKHTISLGFQPIGKKQFEGDGKTPEGKYFIVSKNNHSIAFKKFGNILSKCRQQKICSSLSKINWWGYYDSWDDEQFLVLGQISSFYGLDRWLHRTY